MESIAGSGEIFVSGTVRDQVRDKLDLIRHGRAGLTTHRSRLATVYRVTLAAAETTATRFAYRPLAKPCLADKPLGCSG
jgi:hypothetical protein